MNSKIGSTRSTVQYPIRLLKLANNIANLDCVRKSDPSTAKQLLRSLKQFLLILPLRDRFRSICFKIAWNSGE